MFLVDNAIAAVAPAQTSERRIKARSKARDLGRHCDWLRLVVQQHEQIEQVLAQLAAAVDVAGARRAEQTLATLLTGHSVAEEAVLYPAMASARQKAHAVTAFSEQARLKVQLAALATREPATPEWRAELDRLAQSISEHLFDEECSWFPALAKVDDAALQARLSARFVAEYERYLGGDVPA
jgi:iron-sulfur cluster repair protein YtfE (RIC family)